MSAPAEGWQAQVERAAAGIRRRVLAHTVANHGGYLSQACCAAELLATLYLRVMRLGPPTAPPVAGGFPGVPGSAAAGPRGVSGAAYNGCPAPDTDRFILSPAHYALVLYATLIEAGRLSEDGLAAFNRDGSSVEMIGAEHSPGMEVTSGSLGQALSVAIGQAIGRRKRGHTGLMHVLLSDGELQEGQTWEAFHAAAHYRLDSVRVYLDANGFQCDGPVERVMEIEPIAKVRAFGWTVHEVDGHDVVAIDAAARTAEPQRPLLVVCRTKPWQGIPALKDRFPKYHYVRFRDGEAEAALADLGMRSEDVRR